MIPSYYFRRLLLKVPKHARVLEVGSGDNPYPRSNILVDLYRDTPERGWAPLKTDRPTFIADVCDLPFRDKSFDFVIASHVLEHTSNPRRFLDELSRVAKAGYIETPDALMERLNPYRHHKLEVTVRNDKLILRKKRSWLHDPELVELYEHKAKPLFIKFLIQKHPDSFFTRYYWIDKIMYQILDENLTQSFEEPAIDEPLDKKIKPLLIYKPFSSIKSILTKLYRLSSPSFDLTQVLKCNQCLHTSFFKATSDESNYICSTCGSSYRSVDGAYSFFPSNK
jgi:SAM-dependent methyltransferase